MVTSANTAKIGVHSLKLGGGGMANRDNGPYLRDSGVQERKTGKKTPL